MRETSLDDFIGEDDAGDQRGEQADDAQSNAGEPTDDDPTPGGDAAGGTASGGEAVGRRSDGDAPEPAVSTFDWTPNGAACAACGTGVERRWREDGELVCADCKAW